MNTLPSLTRKSRRILPRDRQLKLSREMLLEVKVTLPDLDRELNCLVSWPQLMLKSHHSVAVEVVEDAVVTVAAEDVVVVDPMLLVPREVLKKVEASK